MDWISDFLWGLVGPLGFVIWLIGEGIEWLSTWSPLTWLAIFGLWVWFLLSQEQKRLWRKLDDLEERIQEHRTPEITPAQKERRDAWQAASDAYDLLPAAHPTDPKQAP